MCRTIGLPERTFHAAKTRPRSARSISDERHKVEIRRVWTSNYSLLWAAPRLQEAAQGGLRHRPLHRHAAHGRHRSARRAARPQAVHDHPRRHCGAAGGPGRAPVRRRATEPAVARRHHLRVDVAGLAVRRVHPRRALPDDRRLAARQPSPHRPRPRRARDGVVATRPHLRRSRSITATGGRNISASATAIVSPT